MRKTGKLAKEWCGVTLPLQVCSSGAGFYIGCMDEGGPVSRESAEYWETAEQAQASLDADNWIQKETP